jgi:hypothetical protein
MIVMEAVNGGCYGKTGSGNAMEINWTPQAIDSLIETVRFVDCHFGKRIAQDIVLLKDLLI